MRRIVPAKILSLLERSHCDSQGSWCLRVVSDNDKTRTKDAEETMIAATPGHVDHHLAARVAPRP